MAHAILGGMDEAVKKPIPPAADPYAAYWRRRNAEAAAEVARLKAEAQEDARAIADLLRRDFGATRDILFGVPARGGFSPYLRAPADRLP